MVVWFGAPQLFQPARNINVIGSFHTRVPKLLQVEENGVNWVQRLNRMCFSRVGINQPREGLKPIEGPAARLGVHQRLDLGDGFRVIGLSLERSDVHGLPHIAGNSASRETSTLLLSMIVPN